ncbi:MAG: hypothetical protein FJ295_19935 [Planctomycetes bacterium]|nr:hypothetical protein [Planctomycetota bacterium]
MRVLFLDADAHFWTGLEAHPTSQLVRRADKCRRALRIRLKRFWPLDTRLPILNRFVNGPRTHEPGQTGDASRLLESALRATMGQHEQPGGVGELLRALCSEALAGTISFDRS